jgi:hypothetical protein
MKIEPSKYNIAANDEVKNRMMSIPINGNQNKADTKGEKIRPHIVHNFVEIGIVFFFG